MLEIFHAVFDKNKLREPVWICYSPRRDASPVDVEFWVERRGLHEGLSKNGKRIYGNSLEEGNVCEIAPTR